MSEVDLIERKVREFAAILLKYYQTVPGATSPVLVNYHIEQKLEEFITKLKEDSNNEC